MPVVDASKWMGGMDSFREVRHRELSKLFSPRMTEERFAEIRSERAGKRTPSTKIERLRESRVRYGLHLRKIRNRREMTQAQAASRLGIPRTTINMLEAGFGAPSQRIAKLIAAEFGVHWSEYWGEG